VPGAVVRRTGRYCDDLALLQQPPDAVVHLRTVRSSALWVALVFAPPAFADEGAYLFVAGPGASFRPVASQPGMGATLFAESVFGLTDRWNWEAPLWVDLLNSRVDLSLGGGMEYVFLRAGRWQWNVGGGTLASIPLGPLGPVEFGPYLEAAIRMKIIWGLGVGLETHAGYLWAIDGSVRTPFGGAALAVHYEL
jgi:hypothetical protein